MKKHLLGGLAAVLVVGISASAAHSACDFPHPKKATKFQSTFVEAFVSCGNLGGNSPNTTTEGGVPSCKPPETYSQQAGNAATGWKFDPLKGSGQVQFKPLKVPGPNTNPLLNPTGDTTDLAVSAKLGGVIDSIGPVTGNGFIATSARATFNDRAGQCVGGTNAGGACNAASACPGGACGGTSMTVTDFPANFGIIVTAGKGKLKTSADVLLNGISQPGLPHCTSIETVSITVLDGNGDTFANTGTFLP